MTRPAARLGRRLECRSESGLPARHADSPVRQRQCLAGEFGGRCRYPHRYPDSHPQAKSKPQDSWCYPLAALGCYREWLQDTYIEGGKFSSYLKAKVARGELAPSVAQLAITAMAPAQIAAAG